MFWGPAPKMPPQMKISQEVSCALSKSSDSTCTTSRAVMDETCECTGTADTEATRGQPLQEGRQLRSVLVCTNKTLHDRQVHLVARL